MSSSRFHITTLLPLVSVLLTAAPLSAQSSGDLMGCVTNTMNQRLPGVTVVVRASGFEQRLLADAEGCYQAKALPPNQYRVTVVLSGFDNETRQNVRIEPRGVMRVDFQMRISTICECLSYSTLLEGWESVDSVVHLRITDDDSELPSPRATFRHTAEVLEVFKRHPAVPVDFTMTFLQRQASGEPIPYDVGDEFVMFLQWSPNLQTFLVHSQWPSAFAIQAGRIKGGDAAYDLLAELRTFSARK